MDNIPNSYFLSLVVSRWRSWSWIVWWIRLGLWFARWVWIGRDRVIFSFIVIRVGFAFYLILSEEGDDIADLTAAFPALEFVRKRGSERTAEGMRSGTVAPLVHDVNALIKSDVIDLGITLH
jgi:hypothetical protein